MYLEHFQFREYPFRLTPDTDYFFAAECHQDAMNTLLVALRSGEGFLKVTGEVGLGKTMLCRQLLRELDENCVTAYIPDPQLSPSGLRGALAAELSIRVLEHWTDEQLLRRIRTRLLTFAAQGKRVVLILDEAHQLSVATLESVRLLSNLETAKFKLLQIVLFGQPELDRRLAGNDLRQLRQRIGFSCELRPLDRPTTGAYIESRLQSAGCPIEGLFSTAAVTAIHRASGGIPRVINTLCHKALIAAFGGTKCQVTRQHARRAIVDSLAVIEPAPWLRGRLGGRLAHWYAVASLVSVSLLPGFDR